MVRILSRTLVIAATVAITMTTPACKHKDKDSPKELLPCPAEVTVSGNAPVTCDLRRPSTLTVTDVDEMACTGLGGHFIAPSTCKDVDY